MKDLLIAGATVVTVDEENNIYAPGDIVCDNGKLVYVGPSREWGNRDFKRVLLGNGKIIIPGLINTHTHSAMTLFRSYADDLALDPWLKKKIWPLESKLTPEAVYWGSLLACVEMMESGVTTFADMYFFMDQVAKAVVESGLRADLSVGLTGMDPTKWQESIAEATLFVERHQGTAGGRISTRFGPHAPYTCPKPFLIDILRRAHDQNCGVHIHLAETQAEVTEITSQTGLTPVEFYCDAMDNVGMVKTIAAHCVHINNADIDNLYKNNIGVAHNPGSNLKLASGIAPLPALLKKDINVGLGTDGAASNNNLDLLEEARLAALIHKGVSGDPTVVTATDALRLATIKGAQALHMAEEIGSLKVNKQADLVIIDEEEPNLFPCHDPVSRIIYAASTGNVWMVIVAGTIIVEKGQAITVDRREIMARAQMAIDRIC